MKNKSIIRVMLAILGGLAFVYVAALIQKKVQQQNFPPQPTPIVQYQTVVCSRDIDSFKTLELKGRLANLLDMPESMYATNGVFINAKTVVTKDETKDSKVACGYLYVKANTDKGPLVSYEDVYINPDNYGGHLDKSNQFGTGDNNNFSEYLFALDDINYWKTRNTKGSILNADWASLLNVSPKVTFVIALNTQDPSGIVDRVSIAYKCKNPVTGEENSGCKLDVSTPEIGKSQLP